MRRGAVALPMPLLPPVISAIDIAGSAPSGSWPSIVGCAVLNPGRRGGRPGRAPASWGRQHQPCSPGSAYPGGMSESTNTLGEYLRARRELVTPESVGLPQLGVRRTPGLRREEFAMLAGISADYYLRLEQGRDRNPSVQVLEALA